MTFDGFINVWIALNGALLLVAIARRVIANFTGQ